MEEKRKKIRNELLKDCFGAVPGRLHCHVLTEDVCLYGKCPFYKTRKQFEDDRKKYSLISGNLKRIGRYSGKNVRCINTGKIYPTIRGAAEDLGISASAISLVLNNKQKTTAGLGFEYV